MLCITLPYLEEKIFFVQYWFSLLFCGIIIVAVCNLRNTPYIAVVSAKKEGKKYEFWIIGPRIDCQEICGCMQPDGRRKAAGGGVRQQGEGGSIRSGIQTPSIFPSSIPCTMKPPGNAWKPEKPFYVKSLSALLCLRRKS